jgi:secernin
MCRSFGFRATDLLERHGQGGGCGYEKRSFTYHHSFIVADPTDAWVLETAGSLWATEQVRSGVRTISNGLTIPGFASEHRKWLETKVSACDIRTSLTAGLATGATGPGDLIATLRSHGSNRWPRYNAINGTLSMPCMHGGGVAASSSSVARWVSDLMTRTHLDQRDICPVPRPVQAGVGRCAGRRRTYPRRPG